MASKTAICNLALSRIGVTLRLTNVDQQGSREALVLRGLFDLDLDAVLREFPWPFATRYADLALVGGLTTRVNNDWQYSYRYPSDCIYARRIAIAGVGRSNPNPPPFRVGSDSQGRLIYTNEASAQLEYTGPVTDPEILDALCVSALAWKLAAGASPLSRIKGIAEHCATQYAYDITTAQTRALNESQQEEPNEAESITARD